jgi:hypothetical protein
LDGGIQTPIRLAGLSFFCELRDAVSADIVEGRGARGWIIVCKVDACVSCDATSPTNADESVDIAEVGIACNSSAVVTEIAS